MYKILFSFLLLLSCSNQNVNTFISEQNLKEINLSASKKYINKIWHPLFFYSLHNHLFVSSLNTDTVLYIYTLPQLEYKDGFGIKGEGKGEYYIPPMFIGSSSQNLYISGKSYSEIEKYAIDESGNMLLDSVIDTKITESCNQMYIIGDTTLIYNSLPKELSIKKYDLKRNKIIDKITFKPDNHSSTYFYTNKGNIVSNDSLIVYYYSYKNQIDIYNISTMSLRKRIVGKYKPTQIVVGERNSINYYYINAFISNKYIYALCQNGQYGDYTKMELEVYDFNGNVVKKYTFDIPPIFFIVDEKSELIWGYNPQYEDYFLSYKI